MPSHWAPGNVDLPASGVSAGTYGDATHVGQVTVDAAGRVTAAASVGITGGGGGGTELDYVQITAAVTVTATADGNGNGTAVIDGNAVTYDGATRVCIEFFCPLAAINPSFQQHSVYVNLYDGTTDLGRLGRVTADVAAVSEVVPFFGRLFLTPTAAAHTYHVRAWKDAAGDTAILTAGAGGASAYLPAYYRITTA